jgi:Amt family ammonium transporter
MRFKGEREMKRFLSILCATLAIGLAAPVMAEDPPAAPVAAEAAAPAADAPAAPEAAPVAAEAAPAEAAPAEEVKAEVHKGDVAWMLVSTIIVLFMALPGLALFYGGMVRAKNMLSVLMQVMVVFSLIGVLWVVYGYSLHRGHALHRFAGQALPERCLGRIAG